MDKYPLLTLCRVLCFILASVDHQFMTTQAGVHGDFIALTFTQFLHLLHPCVRIVTERQQNPKVDCAIPTDGMLVVVVVAWTYAWYAGFMYGYVWQYARDGMHASMLSIPSRSMHV